MVNCRRVPIMRSALIKAFSLLIHVVIFFIVITIQSQQNKHPTIASHNAKENIDKLIDIHESTFVNKTTDEELWYEEQKRRKTRVDTMCRVYKFLVHAPDLRKLIVDPSKFENLIVDEKHKALYCYIPKIACTELKRLLLVITNTTNHTMPKNIEHMEAHDNAMQMRLSLFSREEILHRLTKYKKFMFVRHPLERLVSAFRDKFEGNSEDARNFRQVFGTEMMRKYRNKSDVPESGVGIKFLEFISYITTEKNAIAQQEHWRQYYHLCHPCSVRYDYIGKYSTIEEDANRIFKIINTSQNVTFPPFKRSKTNELVFPYFKVIPRRIFQLLKRKFEPDFALYDYSSILNSTNLI